MHRLFYSSASPYARKARVLVEESGLGNLFQMVAIAPFERPKELLAHNPLSKIPTLVCEDSLVIYDSPVIIEFIDGLSAQPILPAGGRRRWEALRRQALADGIMDAGVSMLLEGRRPASEQSPQWIERQGQTIWRSLAAVEQEITHLDDAAGLAQIAFGCALGWLDFRLPTLAWQKACPHLADWNKAFQQRPSMMNTRPS